MGFPGTCGFIGEFLIMLGVFQINPFVVFLGGFSLIFSGIYSIWLFNRLVFSFLKVKFQFKFFSDLNYRELSIIIPLIFFVFFLGFAPAGLLHFYDIFLYSFFFLFRNLDS